MDDHEQRFYRRWYVRAGWRVFSVIVCLPAAAGLAGIGLAAVSLRRLARYLVAACLMVALRFKPSPALVVLTAAALIDANLFKFADQILMEEIERSSETVAESPELFRLLGIVMERRHGRGMAAMAFVAAVANAAAVFDPQFASEWKAKNFPAWWLADYTAFEVCHEAK